MTFRVKDGISIAGTLFVDSATNVSATSVAISRASISTSTLTGALLVSGGAGIGGNLYANYVNTPSLTATNVAITGLTASTSTNSGALTVAGGVGIGGNTYINGNLYVTGSTISIGTATNLTAAQIPLGSPSDGSFTNNNPAITSWTTATLTVDAVDKLNEVLGKLVPSQPNAFPGTWTLAIAGTATGGILRMTDFVQPNNTISGSKQISSGTSLSNYTRVSTFNTTVIRNIGPGESGTVSAVVNGVTTGSRVMVATTGNNGTYGSLVISSNVDYSTISGQASGFWYAFSTSATGVVSTGWNDVYITDTAAGTSNAPSWYYDASAPGSPGITVNSFSATTVVLGYSSSVPHYVSGTVWTYTATVVRLSGDMYPNTDTFLTGSAGGQFLAPASRTYAQAGIATPLARNLYVASGSAIVTTTASIVTTTGASNVGPGITVANGYSNTIANPFISGGTVLTLNTATTTVPNEINIVTGAFGSGGTAYAYRVGGLAATVTPVTSAITSWVSSASILTTDATVVAGKGITNDVTNYSTGYFPAGPNLSASSSTQYITFRIQRSATSKFDIATTGKFSGCYVALPGSSIDTTAAGTNGWITPTLAYAGAGVPGNGVGGNGSNGCATGGVMTVGSLVTQSVTVTFGTESSTNSTNNYIYVRFVMNTGDSITALSFPIATH